MDMDMDPYCTLYPVVPNKKKLQLFIPYAHGYGLINDFFLPFHVSHDIRTSYLILNIILHIIMPWKLSF